LQSVFNAGVPTQPLRQMAKLPSFITIVTRLALQFKIVHQLLFYADAISPTMQLQEQKNGVMTPLILNFSAQKQMGLKLFFIPSKPIGDYTLATLDSLPHSKYGVFYWFNISRRCRPPVVVVLQDDFNVGFNVVRFKVGGYLLEFYKISFIGGDLKFHSSIAENYYKSSILEEIQIMVLLFNRIILVLLTQMICISNFLGLKYILLME
jgi:hypothetical protein